MHKIKLRNSPPKLAYSYYPSSTQVLVETETYVERLIFYKQDYRN